MVKRKTLSDLIDASWLTALDPIADKITELGDFLRAELAAGRGFLPNGNDILRAFQSDFNAVKVLILGQDPYPTIGHAMGLSFSVPATLRSLPLSLRNIFKELSQDLNLPLPSSGDLTPWMKQGVLLLNRVLTVSPGKPGSHRGKGWEEVTECAITALANRNQPLVAVLWGRDAYQAKSLMPNADIIASAHPSPLSAQKGFFNSRPFSKINTLLEQHQLTPINWQLP